ncbi:MAG TPA: PEP/pyruvate-binding domain-containing protein [Bryobacteraceae bacterium]|nr:PEP/pyruvate-binding domain-containing protein [Bryobacteraceae bacterium]
MSVDLYKILPHSPLPKGGAGEVGNKAWNLMQMSAAGLPVPAALVLSAAFGRIVLAGDGDQDLAAALPSGIAALETATGLGFGSPRRPLLVSVRSGAAVSMPGMLETVLNVGMNTATIEGMIAQTGNPRLAWDCYRRLVQGYAEVVEGLPRGPFDELVAQGLKSVGVEKENELDHATLRDLTGELLNRFEELAGFPFPEDPIEQLRQAALAVFRSWDAPKAVAYRRANGIDPDGGTSVTVQRMVYGNAGGDSGAGVAFTRNPATGAAELYLDFEFNAQGEDVVAGRLASHGDRQFRRTLPRAWAQLEEAGHALEALFHDAQDFEFTLQSGTLYLLQSRSAKRTAWAALHIAVDQVDEGLITPAEALSRLAGINLASVVRTRAADPGARPLAHAQAASLGVATGAIALDSESAKRMAGAGKPVILVRPETETADIEGILSAAGILTAAGGRTSHAAVVARQLGKVCLVACADLEIDLPRRACRIGDRAMQEGEWLSLDGNDGGVYAGHLEVVTERPERELAHIEGWRRSADAA